MNTIARFFKAEDAYLFRSFLESEGVSAYVFDEFMPTVHWLHTIAVGGIRVVVAPEDAERALEIFREYDQTVSAIPPVEGPIRYWPAVLAMSLVISVPFMFFGRRSINRPE